MAKWFHVLFDKMSDSGKTEINNIAVNVDGSGHLGKVKWFGRWRKYAFFPAEDTVFEQDCLRDIADVCERMTKKHRELTQQKVI